MRPVVKVSLSLLLAVVFFSIFAFLAFSGLFEVIETTFFSPRVFAQYRTTLSRTANQIEAFHSDQLQRLEAVLSNDSMRTVFRANQSQTDILTRDQLISRLRGEQTGFEFVQFFDLDATRLHFSSRSSDFSGTGVQRVYVPLEELPERETVVPLVQSSPTNSDVLLYPDRNFFVYRVSINDTEGILRGVALFFYNAFGLSNRLIQNGYMRTGTVVHIITDDALLVGVERGESVNLAEQIRPTLEGEGEQAFRVETDDGVQFLVPQIVHGETRLATIAPLQEFLIGSHLQVIILVGVFLTAFLLIFLLLNIRQDSTLLLSERIKRLQISLLKEYVENRNEIDFDRWQAELRSRKPEVVKRIRRGVGRVRRSEKDELDQLAERGWEEIVELLSRRASAPSDGAVDMARIEQMIERVLQNLPARVRGTEGMAGTATAASDPEQRALPDPGSSGSEASSELEELGEIEEAEEVEEIAELDETDELEQIEEAESVDDLEEIEEAGELEEFEELDVVEAGAEGEDLEEVEEIADRDEADELEEVEEAEELDDLDEIEEATELEEVEEVDEVAELDEADELEEVDAVDVTDDVDDLEEIEDVAELEDAEEIEEVDDVEGIEEAGEADELDALEEVEEIEEIEAADDTEEIEEVAELEEVEELEETVEADDIDDLEEIEEVVELDDADEAEPLVELSGGRSNESVGSLSFASRSGKPGAPVWEFTQAAVEQELEAITNQELADVEGGKIDSQDPVAPRIAELSGFELVERDEFLRLVGSSSVIEETEGVYRIDTALYERASGGTGPIEAHTLGRSEGNASDYWYDDDLILLGPTSVAPARHAVAAEKTYEASQEYRSPTTGRTAGARSGESDDGDAIIRSCVFGLDYDRYLEGFRPDDGGVMRSLVYFTRSANARSALLAVSENESFTVTYQLGVDDSCDGRLSVDAGSELNSQVMQTGSALSLDVSLAEIPGVKAGCETSHLEAFTPVVFLPVGFRGKSGYLIMSMYPESGSISDIISRVRTNAHFPQGQ